MSLAVPALLCSVFSSAHTKLQIYYHFGLSFALPVSTQPLGYSSKLESSIKVSSIKYLHELCFSSDREREEGQGCWGARPLCYFLQLLALNMAEKTLRTKFREMHSPAAVSGVLPGGCTCIQQRGRAPPRVRYSDSGWVRSYCCSRFHGGKLKQGEEKHFI